MIEDFVVVQGVSCAEKINGKVEELPAKLQALRRKALARNLCTETLKVALELYYSSPKGERPGSKECLRIALNRTWRRVRRFLKKKPAHDFYLLVVQRVLAVRELLQPNWSIDARDVSFDLPVTLGRTALTVPVRADFILKSGKGPGATWRPLRICPLHTPQDFRLQPAVELFLPSAYLAAARSVDDPDVEDVFSYAGESERRIFPIVVNFCWQQPIRQSSCPPSLITKYIKAVRNVTDFSVFPHPSIELCKTCQKSQCAYRITDRKLEKPRKGYTADPVQ